MNKSDQNKLMVTAMIVVGLLVLKCMVSDTKEYLDPSTAEWIEQPTDIVMPSINEESLKDRLYPQYQPNVVVNPDQPTACVANDVAKSHLIFKDGVVPRDYETADNLHHPEEVLESSELLPDDEFNTWSDVNPAGTGSIAYKNFLSNGHSVGQINVLRNADLSLRTSIVNPQFNTGPWSQSTILPNEHAGNTADVCV
jgi:hypothetical protein